MTNRPQTGRRYRTAAPARGKREQPASRRGDRHLRQLAVSGVVLLAVVLVKISAPAAMDKCRDKLLDLMGGQTDFRAAFSAVGRAVSGQGAVGQALNDAYTAVFGPQQTVPEGTADPAAYSAETTPGDVCLTQQVLGFAYAAPGRELRSVWQEKMTNAISGASLVPGWLPIYGPETIAELEPVLAELEKKQ